MAVDRPKLIIDTDVFINASNGANGANGGIPTTEWEQLRSHAEANYEYCLSFITMLELFVGLSRCATDKYEQNKSRIRLFVEFGKWTILPYPVIFAVRSVLGINVYRSAAYEMPEEHHYELMLEWVLESQNKKELKRGLPNRDIGRLRGYIPSLEARASEGMILAFDLDKFCKIEHIPQMEHADLLSGLRNGTTHIADRLTRTDLLLQDHGITTTEEERSHLTISLDAVYVLAERLYGFSKGNYDFEKRASDWGDMMQLFHLADESMHFLTYDGKLKERTRDSTQASRILWYPDFIKTIG